MIDKTSNLLNSKQIFGSKNLSRSAGDPLKNGKDKEGASPVITDGDFISTNNDWATGDWLMNNGSGA